MEEESNQTEERRSTIDRRSGKDRRRRLNWGWFTFRGLDRDMERRSFKERRVDSERRSGWIRVGRWASARLKDLKISKFLTK